MEMLKIVLEIVEIFILLCLVIILLNDLKE